MEREKIKINHLKRKELLWVENHAKVAGSVNV